MTEGGLLGQVIFERKFKDEKLLARCEKRGEETLGSRDRDAVLG